MRLRLVEMLAAWVLVCVAPATAPAALDDLGLGTILGGDGSEYKLIYDDALDLTWLDYSRPEDTWAVQVGWAAGLTVSFNGLDLADWRLPEAEICVGSCPGSEMKELYNELVHKYDTIEKAVENGPFDDLNLGAYWYGTEGTASDAYAIGFSSGSQILMNKDTPYYGLAVRDGNPVPLPPAFYLLGTGLLALLWRRFRISRRAWCYAPLSS